MLQTSTIRRVVGKHAKISGVMLMSLFNAVVASLHVAAFCFVQLGAPRCFKANQLITNLDRCTENKTDTPAHILSGLLHLIQWIVGL